MKVAEISSKNLSRKEILKEYAKLRELFDIQKVELDSKTAQIRHLTENARKWAIKVKTRNNGSESALVELESRLRKEFDAERQDMLDKLKQCNAINRDLLERVNAQDKAELEPSISAPRPAANTETFQIELVDSHERARELGARQTQTAA